MLLEQSIGAVVRFAKQLLDFLVDELGGAFAEVARLLNFLAQKHVLLADPEGHWAETIAHAPVRHHVAGETRGLLEIVLLTGKGLSVDETIRCPPAASLTAAVAMPRRQRLALTQ